MQLGLIGLGRMGSNIVRRVVRAGHRCVVFDRDAKAVASLVTQGVTGADDLQRLVSGLERPRAVWVMVPAGAPTEETVARWAIDAAVEEAVPAEVLAAALFARFRSRQRSSFSDKLLSALRHEFGGHREVLQR
jgi:6-phosphogluconate dehydrogenase (decarboxylating)